MATKKTTARTSWFSGMYALNAWLEWKFVL